MSKSASSKSAGTLIPPVSTSPFGSTLGGAACTAFNGVREGSKITGKRTKITIMRTIILLSGKNMLFLFLSN
jgi:hypothetical protein